MANLVFIHASDGSNALLAREVEGYAVNMGHTVDHVSLNACDFPVYTVTVSYTHLTLPTKRIV